QHDMFWAGRFFRPEAPMLFWQMVGLLLLVCGYPGRRRMLALAGVALALATLSKLFGGLAAVGVGLFILVDGLAQRDLSDPSDLRGPRDWRGPLRALLAVFVPYALLLALVTVAFTALTHYFVPGVLGHHLRQGSGTPALMVLRKALGLYRDYALAQPAYVALAAVGLALALASRQRAARLFFWQAPTALAFLAITRELQPRHLTYLVPSLAAGGGVALWVAARRLARWRRQADWRRWPGFALAALLVIGGLAAALYPQVVRNAWVLGWEEHTTAEWVAYIQAHTRPDEVVIADYPGLNFYAQRRTTRMAAGISRGAALGGQILGADLIREIEASDAPLVLINVAQGAHQFVLLRDYPAFKAYVQGRYRLAERRVYDSRLIEIYARADLWPGEIVDHDLGHLLRLTGVNWYASAARPGDQLQVALRWQSLAAMPQDYRVSLRVMDDEGQEWGLGSKVLVDVDKDTYWDELGLERAVPVLTSQWPAGEQTIQVYELPVDEATPPGAYRVWVRVHPQDAWAGLPLLDEGDRALGYDVDIGSVTVTPSERLVAPEALPIGQRLAVPLAPALRLVGYDLAAGPYRPGDRLHLSLYWQAVAPGAEAYAQVALTLERDGVVALMQRAPIGRGAPVAAWGAGQVLKGQYDLIVPPELASGAYALRVMPLAPGASAPPSAAAYTLTTVDVAGRQRLFAAPPMQHAAGAALGNAATLLGYDVAPTTVAPGGVVDLTLYWRAEQPLDKAYTVFTHLIDDRDRVWGGQDNEPAGGAAPTIGWLPGEIIVDRYAIGVRPDTPSGAYRLEVGLYDPRTGRRLSGADAAQEPLRGDRILLDAAPLRVGPE
ncbi:MAG: phospholipid carrier-dependent glycosyltransferase, partial [Chloroflexota bacterium]